MPNEYTCPRCGRTLTLMGNGSMLRIGSCPNDDCHVMSVTILLAEDE